MNEQFMIMRVKQPNIILTETEFSLVPVVGIDRMTIKYFPSPKEAKKEIESLL